MTVTCDVCTKDRYDLLAQCLLSVALQTVKPKHVIITDDSDAPKDIRELACAVALHLFDEYGISWEVNWGSKRGQHVSHQHVQEVAKTDLVYRLDDDEIAMPDTLERLLSNLTEDVGAVAGLVLSPNAPKLPPDAESIITDLNRPSVQWFTQPPRVIEVDHLHSTFLYRRGLVDYELSLSPAAHREETLFTYEIKRKGYKVLIDTSAVTWHFRAAQGGIRSHRDASFWEHDERIFESKLLEWGVNCKPTKIIVLDCGRGDHVIVKSLLPRLKEKYGKIIVATSYGDIFNGEVEQISIADAKNRFGDIERFNIYRWMIDHQWRGNLVNAYEKLYDIC